MMVAWMRQSVLYTNQPTGEISLQTTKLDHCKAISRALMGSRSYLPLNEGRYLPRDANTCDLLVHALCVKGFAFQENSVCQRIERGYSMGHFADEEHLWS